MKGLFPLPLLIVIALADGCAAPTPEEETPESCENDGVRCTREVRDDATGTYWSPSWQPVGVDVEDYECRHGMGYTRVTGSKNGIRASVAYFVPLGANVEIQHLTLENGDSQALCDILLANQLDVICPADMIAA